MLPDGRPELILHLGDPFERVHANGVAERQAHVLFAGQLTRQLVLRPTGRIAVIGIRFHPDGAANLLAAPQRHLAGLTLPILDVLPALHSSLSEVRSETDSTERGVDLLMERLAPRLTGIRPNPGESRHEPLHQQNDSFFRRAGFASDFFKARMKRRKDVVDGQREAGEMALRRREQVRCAVRMEADADHRDAAGRTQHELPRELAGEQQVRLPLRDAVLVRAFERIAEMKDQLGPPVGQHGLKVRRELARAAFERPDTLDAGSQSIGRRELAVLQGAPTLSRNVVENSA